MIVENIVKIADDISILKKTKEGNHDAIKALETKMNVISQEIELTGEKIMDNIT